MQLVSEILEAIQEWELGYWNIGAQRDLLVRLEDIIATDALTAKGSKHLSDAITLAKANPEAAFQLIFERVLANPENFRNRGIWGYYWYLVRIMHELAYEHGLNGDEPTVNGAFLSKIVSSSRTFEPMVLRQGQTKVSVGATHLVRKLNEGKIGADFALVLALEENGVSRYFPTIIQAKVADNFKVDIHRRAQKSTQLSKLVSSGIGHYVFYNRFEQLAPTGLSAEAAKSALLLETFVHSTRVATDFAVHAGLLIPHARNQEGELEHPCLDSPLDALRAIYRIDIEDIVHLPIMVAVIDERGFDRNKVRTMRRAWKDALDACKLEHEQRYVPGAPEI